MMMFRSTSAPDDSFHAQIHTENVRNIYGGISKGGGNVVKKLREKTTKPSTNSTTKENGKSTKGNNNINNNNFKISVDVAETGDKRNATDFDLLLENFQNGTTLKKLQAELAQSKQSIAKSENFMRNLSKEYL